jgi:hypothetical protein
MPRAAPPRDAHDVMSPDARRGDRPVVPAPSHDRAAAIEAEDQDRDDE